MKIGVNTVKKGNILDINGALHEVVDFYTTQPGKGGAFSQIKLRNMDTGSIFEKRFRTAENVERIVLQDKDVQYLYNDGEDYFFMDNETYEQFPLSKEILGDKINYLIENMVIVVRFNGNTPITIQLPPAVNLEIEYTEPGVKGNTASGNATKPATLVTGFQIQVPLFINIGEVVKVDTRTGEYMERAK
jgi:elongation factor P